MVEGSILVISNEQGIARSLKITLAAKGYEVTNAYNIDEAVRLTGSRKHDLVLLDSDFSSATAIDACRELRASSDTAIVVISSDNSAEKRARAIMAGADAYIAKPFGVAEIFAGVEACLRKTAHPPVFAS
jgi:DNA-binding response OmpR family regulator